MKRFSLYSYLFLISTFLWFKCSPKLAAQVFHLPLACNKHKNASRWQLPMNCTDLFFRTSYIVKKFCFCTEVHTNWKLPSWDLDDWNIHREHSSIRREVFHAKGSTHDYELQWHNCCFWSSDHVAKSTWFIYFFAVIFIYALHNNRSIDDYIHFCANNLRRLDIGWHNNTCTQVCLRVDRKHISPLQIVKCGDKNDQSSTFLCWTSRELPLVSVCTFSRPRPWSCSVTQECYSVPCHCYMCNYHLCTSPHYIQFYFLLFWLALVLIQNSI